MIDSNPWHLIWSPEHFQGSHPLLRTDPVIAPELCEIHTSPPPRIRKNKKNTSLHYLGYRDSLAIKFFAMYAADSGLILNTARGPSGSASSYP